MLVVCCAILNLEPEIICILSLYSYRDAHCIESITSYHDHKADIGIVIEMTDERYF